MERGKLVYVGKRYPQPIPVFTFPRFSVVVVSIIVVNSNIKCRMDHDTDLGKELGSWDVESTIKVAKQLPTLGIDLLDVSSGGNHPDQRIDGFNTKDYQVKIADRIRNVVHADNLKLLIGAVGLITEAEQARDIVEQAGTVAQLKNGIHKEAEAAKKMTDAKDGKLSRRWPKSQGVNPQFPS